MYTQKRLVALSHWYYLSLIIFICTNSLIKAESFQELFNQAIDSFRNKQFERAATLFEQALLLNPHNPQAHFNCGLALASQKKYDDAISHYLQAIRLDTHYSKAYLHLGNVYRNKKQNRKAEETYRKALIHDAKNSDVLLALARLLHDSNEFDEAEYYFRQALQAQPDNITIMFELANSLNMNNNTDEAIHFYNKIIESHPKNISVLYNIAYSLKRLGKIEEALALYKHVLTLNPQHVDAHFGKGLTHLISGDFEHGWPEYEWRLTRDEFKKRMPHVPLWDGSDLSGKAIVLHAEQGLGDTFQFIRYAQVMKDNGATVIAAVQSSLVQLLRLCPYIDTVISLNDQLPPCDYYVPLLSIPAIIKTTEETIPHTIPYLYASPELEHYWKKQLEENSHFKIGICWQGNPNYSTHFLRTTVAAKSIPLSFFKPIMRLPQVTVYSLQRVSGTEQVDQLPSDCRLVTFDDDFDKSHGRFMDTAALIKNLDLVITVDTSIAHLAAGLGIPTWILLPEPPDWRWMLHRGDSPWYPQVMTLFRQPTTGNWRTVIAMVTDALSDYITQIKNNACHIVKAEVSIGELIDKITILHIKQNKIEDPAKLTNIVTELTSLEQTYERNVNRSEELVSLVDELHTVNQQLWNIEDAIREKEHEKEFGPEFVALARNVYFNNDHRGRIKRTINELCGSRLVEEKLYASY